VRLSSRHTLEGRSGHLRTRPRNALQHESASVGCPLLLVDPAQLPRLEEIRANLADRFQEAKEHGWMGEVAAIETTAAAAAQKRDAVHDLTATRTSTHLGMPDIHPSAGRHSPGS
jgi:hypothetical protein